MSLAKGGSLVNLASLVEHKSRSFTIRENGRTKLYREVGGLLPLEEIPIDLVVPSDHAAILVVHSPRNSRSCTFIYEVWPLVDFQPYEKKPLPSPSGPLMELVKVEELTFV